MKLMKDLKHNHHNLNIWIHLFQKNEELEKLLLINLVNLLINLNMMNQDKFNVLLKSSLQTNWKRRKKKKKSFYLYPKNHTVIIKVMDHLFKLHKITLM